ADQDTAPHALRNCVAPVRGPLRLESLPFNQVCERWGSLEPIEENPTKLQHAEEELPVPLQPGEMYGKAPKFLVLVRRAGVVEDEALEATVALLHFDPPRQEA